MGTNFYNTQNQKSNTKLRYYLAAILIIVFVNLIVSIIIYVKPNSPTPSVQIIEPATDIVTKLEPTPEPPAPTPEPAITPTLTFSISNKYKSIETAIPNLRDFITLSQGKKDNVKFTFSPTGIVEMENNKLKVKNAPDTDKTVTITATITVSGQSLTVQETITVKAKKADPVVEDCKIDN